MKLAKRACLIVKYDNKDISADLAGYLLGFSYTDYANGRADDLQITLADRERLWQNGWMPTKGATIEASIVTVNWEQDGKEETLFCGTFEIDEIEPSGPPELVTIKATSIPASSSLRGEDKTRAWEKTKLSLVAGDIAATAGMELLYDTDDDPEYDRIEQTEQSDLSFLQKECVDAGLSLKITDGQIVIFDDSKYEQMEPVMTIERGVTTVLKYSASSTTRDIYSACKVQYHHAKHKEYIEYTYTPPNGPKTGKTLVINQQVTSISEAERLARKSLRQKNKDEIKLSLTLLGNLRLVGGVTVLVKGWGAFDGKYFTDHGTHDISGGYATRVELRRVLEGY